jgi:hypothetical protein
MLLAYPCDTCHDEQEDHPCEASIDRITRCTQTYHNDVVGPSHDLWSLFTRTTI